jgi:hypothetical protein
MKNLYLYLILPAILLVVFLFTPGFGYFAAQEKLEARELASEQESERLKAEEEAKRADIQKRAEEDALERQREREEQDRLKEEKKRKDYEDGIARLKEDIATYSADSDTFTKELNALQLQLSKLRDKKEVEDRQTLELAKQVELAKIERRTAELEIQRMVTMVSKTLTSSPLLKPTPPPAPPTR